MGDGKLKDLFGKRFVPAEDGSGKLFDEELVVEDGPVECLGRTFESDEARREYFLGKLREGLEELQEKLGGVPFTTVEDAVERMASIEKWPMAAREPQREPQMDANTRKSDSSSDPRSFAFIRGSSSSDEFTVRLRELAARMRHADSSKDLLQRWKDEVGFPHGEIEDILNLSDPPYYTACPNPFIADFIKHYGTPYDPVTDNYRREPFAADVSHGKSDPIYQAHSYHTKVPYRAVQHYIDHFTSPGDLVGDFFCGTGMTALAALSLGRIPIVGDLSPYATFIARYYSRAVDSRSLFEAWKRVTSAAQSELPWLYTYEIDGRKVEIQYVVWSDHYFCPNCDEELVFWSIAVDEKEKIRPLIRCPYCDAEVTKRDLVQIRTHTGEVKRSPVKVSEIVNGRRNNRKPFDPDIAIIERCQRELRAYEFPTEMMMFKGERFGDMYVPRQHTGIERVYQFYFPRSLLAAACLYKHISRERNHYIRQFLLWAFLSIQNYINKKQSYFGGGGGQPGTLTISDVIQEKNVFRVFDRKVEKLIRLGEQFQELIGGRPGQVAITTQSATWVVNVKDSSLDYIFTDPPFGRNLMYSELNFINEAWLRVYTNNDVEAIVNRSQGKGRLEYISLMTEAFRECYRVLKPGRWITVEFHNSSSGIWNGIQEALGRAGFVVAQVAILDKKERTFKQLESATGAVDKDLVISAYRPNGGLEERFRLTAGTEEGVWDFVRTHLKQLPVFVSKDGKAEVIAERQNYLLFDRMVAFHVQRGVTVPLSAAEFYARLQRFPDRDGMFFLPEQVAEYDRKRMKVEGVIQLSLFVNDEATAIQWLRQELGNKPQTFQELHPQFLKEIGGWQKHEKPLELSELLEQNFLRYDGKGEVPSQIHSYLSSNFKELRNLPKDDERLRAKAKDRWYVPDPNKTGDLEKLRERALLREFEEYRESRQKRLKVFRLEAVRAGFKKAWQERDYATIIAVARKIPEKVLQEDPKLLMWYDQALTRMGEE